MVGVLRDMGGCSGRPLAGPTKAGEPGSQQITSFSGREGMTCLSPHLWKIC